MTTTTDPAAIRYYTLPLEGGAFGQLYAPRPFTLADLELIQAFLDLLRSALSEGELPPLDTEETQS